MRKRQKTSGSDTYQNYNGFVLRVREEDLVRVDLHHKVTTEVRSAILRGVSDAHIKSVSIIEIIHGYLRGSVLKTAVQKELSSLQKTNTVANFYLSPRNPGSTIVHLT